MKQVSFKKTHKSEYESNAIVWELYINNELVPGFLIGLRKIVMTDSIRGGRRPLFRISYIIKNKIRVKECFFLLQDAKYNLLNRYFIKMLTNQENVV